MFKYKDKVKDIYVYKNIKIYYEQIYRQIKNMNLDKKTCYILKCL